MPPITYEILPTDNYPIGGFASIEKQIDYVDQRITKMESNMISPMEFGELKAEVAAQRRDLDKIVKSIEAMSVKMETIQDTLTEAKGGWKTLLLVGTAFASIGGVITWIVSHVKIV